jgi:Propeptide_C25
MKKLVTYSLATAIGLSGLVGFASTGAVKASEIDTTTVRSTNVEPRPSIIPEPKTVSHHHVVYKKSDYKTMTDLPNEVNYYDKDGFRGVVDKESVIDLGDYYVVCYSGVVLRC